METLIIIVMTALWVWIAYELWSAPTVRENADGTDTIVEPQKKLKDLFKK